MFFFLISHIFYGNIIEDKGRNGNILLNTRRQSSKGVCFAKISLSSGKESSLEIHAE